MTRPSHPNGHATKLLGCNFFSKKALRRAKKNYTLSRFFLHFTKMTTMYNLAEITKFLVRSILSCSANFGPLLRNDGVLES